MKDFATEPDEEKFMKAAHSMVKSLAGSLALVTCREPLRMSMSNNIRGSARQVPGEGLAEGVILMFVNDNIDVVCKVVEEAAEKQSVAVIDDAIQEGLVARAQFRQQQTDESFQWPSVHRFAKMMPEPYKPNEGPSGLTPQQLAIYDNFGPTRAGTSHSALQDGRNQLPDFEAGVPSLPTPAGEPAVPQQQLQPSRGPGDMPETRLNGYTGGLEDMLADVFDAAKGAPEESTKELGPASPVKEAYARLMHFLQTNVPPATVDRTIEVAAHHILSVLFSSRLERRIELEVAAQMLTEMCAFSGIAGHRVWQSLTTSDDELFLGNPKVTIALLSKRLLPLQKIDSMLASAITQREPRAIAFLADLMDSVLLGEFPIALRADFASSIEALSYSVAEEPSNEVGQMLLDRLGGQALGEAVLTPPATKQDEYEHIFDEWIHFYRSSTNEKTIIGFVQQLHTREILKDAESTASFLRACIDFSINAYEGEDEVYGSLDNAQMPVDALAHLIVLLVQYQGDTDGAVKPTKPAYLDSLLALLGLIQCHHFRDRGEHANSKVFFRLYSDLLCGFHEIAKELTDVYDDIVLVFGRLFTGLQPKWFPAFTFSWLGLVSHRFFMAPMLRMGAQSGVSATLMASR
jgi:CCR4-NOT transcription complex subunit 1